MLAHVPPAPEQFTEQVLKNAYVEVMCGVDHSGLWVPGRGWSCRYARGYVEYKGTGIRVGPHECHLCGCYWLMPALTPPDEQRCDNCRGPAVPTGQPSCWPQVLIVSDFLEPGKR